MIPYGYPSFRNIRILSLLRTVGQTCNEDSHRQDITCRRIATQKEMDTLFRKPKKCSLHNKRSPRAQNNIIWQQPAQLHMTHSKSSKNTIRLQTSRFITAMFAQNTLQVTNIRHLENQHRIFYAVWN